MVEVTILIPVADNDGRKFTPTHFAAFERKLLDTFGGFSRLPNQFIGGWLGDDGTEYRDATFGYLVGVDGVIGNGERLREVVDFARAHFKQETIFLRYLGVAEIL